MTQKKDDISPVRCPPAGRWRAEALLRREKERETRAFILAEALPSAPSSAGAGSPNGIWCRPSKKLLSERASVVCTRNYPRRPAHNSLIWPLFCPNFWLIIPQPFSRVSCDSGQRIGSPKLLAFGSSLMHARLLGFLTLKREKRIRRPLISHTRLKGGEGEGMGGPHKCRTFFLASFALYNDDCSHLSEPAGFY